MKFADLKPPVTDKIPAKEPAREAVEEVAKLEADKDSDAAAKEKEALEKKARELYTAYYIAQDGTTHHGVHMPDAERLFSEPAFGREKLGWLAVAKSL